MLVCRHYNSKGKPMTYLGFKIYKYISEEKYPGKTVYYKGHCPKRDIVTKRHKTLGKVKNEIDYITKHYVPCTPLNKALVKMSKKGSACAKLI